MTRAAALLVVCCATAACAALVGLEEKTLDESPTLPDGAPPPSAEEASAPAVDAAAPDASEDAPGSNVFASTLARPSGVAVDGQYVYWTNEGDGTVMRKAHAGGTITVIARGQAEPRQILVDDTSIIWHNANVTGRPGDGGAEYPVLVRALKAEIGPATPLLELDTERNASNLRKMAAGPTNDGVFFSTWQARVRRTRRDSINNGRDIENNIAAKNPTGIAADDNAVYWVEQTPPRLMRAGKADERNDNEDGGENPTEMTALPPLEVADLVSDGKALYLASRDGKIVSVPAPTGKATTPVFTSTPFVRALIAEGTMLYFTRSDASDAPGTGEVVMVPKAGGTETVLMNGLAQPRGIAVHRPATGPRTIYVACHSDGTVRSVTIP